MERLDHITFETHETADPTTAFHRTSVTGGCEMRAIQTAGSIDLDRSRRLDHRSPRRQQRAGEFQNGCLIVDSMVAMATERPIVIYDVCQTCFLHHLKEATES